MNAAIPFDLSDYLELVDYLGRVVHPTKKGSIPDIKPKILCRLNIDAENFVDYADRFLSQFGCAVGIPYSMKRLARTRQNRYLRGISTARAVFGDESSNLAA